MTYVYDTAEEAVLGIFKKAFVCRAVLPPPGLPTPVPQLVVEDTYVEAESG